MIRIAGVLLAAGRGTRFGGDKLAALLAGRPLAHHAAAAADALPLAWRFAVVRGGAAPPGFAAIHNPTGGQGRSLAAGLGTARAVGATAALVMLADMPLVSTDHLGRLLARFRGPDTLAVSVAGDTRLPPALIGSRWFADLEALVADQGAKALLAGADAAVVRADPDELLDVDTPADLARAERRLAGHAAACRR